MSKKTFSTAPKPKQPTDNEILAFERGGAGHDTKTSQDTRPKANDEPTKRLSIDLPVSAHKRFKMACAANDKAMTTEILKFIEKRTTQLEK
jgi:hypothetical protein